VLFASLLVRDRDNAIMSLLAESAESSRNSIGKAVEALGRLDVGNRMVHKCREYLERLLHVLDSLSMCLLNTDAINADDSPGSNIPLAEARAEAAADHVAVGVDAWRSPDVFSSADILDQSPFGIDLGEFMEGDLDFSQFLFPKNVEISGVEVSSMQ